MKMVNVELQLQEHIYEKISELLSKADSTEKASAFVANFLQQKVGDGVIDSYDYTIIDAGINGFQASVEFCFQWNLNNTHAMLVYPKRTLANAFDHAMSII